MSSVTTWSATAGSTRLPSSMPPTSSTVRSRRFSDRHARARARSTGSASGGCPPGGSAEWAASIAAAASEGALGGLDRPRRGRGCDVVRTLVGRAVARPRRRVDGRHEVLADAERLVHLALDLLGDLGVLVQERLGVVAPLAEALGSVGEERAGLRDDVVLDPQVQDAARGRDALAELDVELALAERRCDLVLDHLDADAVAHRLRAVLERLDAADVQPLGGVELQRATARLG